MNRWLKGMAGALCLLASTPVMAQADDLCRDMAATLKAGTPFELRPQFFHEARSQSVEWKSDAFFGDLPAKASLMPHRERLLAEAKALGKNAFTVISWILARSGKDPIFASDPEVDTYTQVPVGNLTAIHADVPGGCCVANRWAFIYWDKSKTPHVVAAPAYIGDRDIEDANNDNAVLTEWQGKPVFVETQLAFFLKGADEQAQLNVTPWLGDRFGATCHIAVSARTVTQPEPSLMADKSVYGGWIRSDYKRWRAEYLAFGYLPLAKRPAYQAAIFTRFTSGHWLDTWKLNAMLAALNNNPRTHLEPYEVAIPVQSGSRMYLAVVRTDIDNDNSMLWTFKVYPPSLLGFGVGKVNGDYYAVRERPVAVTQVAYGSGAFQMP